MPAADVLVIGHGPAGLAAAAACAERGLSVALLGPPGPIRWPARYGAWGAEVRALGLEEVVEQQWAETVVDLGPDEVRVLPHPYARIDRDRLRDQLLSGAERHGVRRLDGEAAGTAHDDAGSTVWLRGGGEARARLVVDATGHRAALTRRPASPAPAFQTALGLTFRATRGALEPGRALLMDWRDEHLSAAERAAAPPTFLYAMPLADGTIFAEETALAARPAVGVDVLERRLRARLRHRGIEVAQVLEREVCWIPMGGAIPHLRQRVVGFGGAAAMVHPATGYMLTRVLAAAPALADTLALRLGAGTNPAAAAAGAWRTLWSRETRARWLLFRYGLEVLLRLDAPRTRDFFRAFFSLPEHQWQGYLLDRLSLPELAAVMTRLFARSGGGLRQALARPLVAPAGAWLLRDLGAALRG